MTDSKFGTIVNQREGQDESDLSLTEARIVLRVSDNIFDKLMMKAQHKGFPNLEAYCESIVISSLTTKVGEPTINSPSTMSEQSAKKITGPSGTGMVTRG